MSLADLQRGMTDAVVRGSRHALAPTTTAPVPAWVALGVHRDTVFGALSNSLRLTFPTVDALVGPAFFDQMSRAYVAQSPPARARLSDYGSAFPEFLAAHPPVSGLPHLPDAARLDLAIGGALTSPAECVRRRVPIDARVSLDLPISLRALTFGYPADSIRAAIDAEDDEALSAIDLTPRPRRVAVWRRDRLAVVTPLSLPAGEFLTAILSGSTADEAVAAAFAVASPQTALAAVQAEVFAAAFCRITENAPEDTAP